MAASSLQRLAWHLGLDNGRTPDTQLRPEDSRQGRGRTDTAPWAPGQRPSQGGQGKASQECEHVTGEPATAQRQRGLGTQAPAARPRKEKGGRSGARR